MYYTDEYDDLGYYSSKRYKPSWSTSWWGGGKKYKSSLGWDEGRLYSTTSRRSYIERRDSDSSDEEVLRKAYKSTRDLIVILDFPFEVSITFTKETYDLSNLPQKIYVASKVLDDTEMPEQNKINIMCGLGVHEAAHLKFSEKRAYSSFKKTIGATYLDECTSKFILILANYLEDNRVEDWLLKDRPGYCIFIEDSKNWSGDTYMRQAHILDISEEEKEHLNYVLCFLQMIRFQNKVKPEVFELYKEDYQDLQKICDTDNLNSTKDSCKIAQEVYNHLLVKFNERFRKHSNEYFNKALYNLVNSYNLLFDEFRCSNDEKSDKLLVSPMDSANIINSDGLIEKLAVGKAEHGIEKNTVFTKPTTTNEKNKYQSSYKRIQSLIPSIKKVISGTDKNFDYNIYGCRSGKLDTNKLAEAYQGVPQVYIRQGHVRTNKTTICILIDESGSMHWNEKFVTARDAAVLLNEALKDLPGVDLYIYGHTADELYMYNTELLIYKEKDYKPTYALGNVSGRSENRDGVAILEAANRVRKFTKEHCLMFVISDGQPAAVDYYGRSAIQDTRKKVLEAQKMDFEIVQVTIDTVCEAKRMFDNVIDLTKDLSEFPNKFGKAIKNAILKNKVTTVTN